MIKCAIYPRKSKQVDSSDSMDAQIAMCIHYLDEHYGKNNYSATIYDGDYGITGHSIKNRKDFKRMMADIAERKIQLVLIQRYDRIARNTRDFCNLYHDMEKNGCNLVSVSQQIDTSTPYGRNFMYMQASMAELEWALNSERRKDANRYARSIGKCTLPNGSIPYGYKAELIDGIRRMVKDPEKEPIVLDIFENYRAFANYCAAAKMVYEKYGEKFSHARIKRIIKQKMYYGEYGGNPRFCEPYITKDEWEKMQENKPVIRFDPNKKTEILFSGMIRCPICKRKMRSCQKRHRNGTIHRYFHCEYTATMLCDFRKVKSEKLLEAMLIEFIQNYIKMLKLEEEKGEENPKKGKDKSKDYQGELDRLNTLFLKGRIDESFYENEYKRISDLLESNKKEADPEKQNKSVREFFFDSWESTYTDLDKLHKKLFWREIIKEIVVNESMEIIDVIFL